MPLFPRAELGRRTSELANLARQKKRFLKITPANGEPFETGDYNICVRIFAIECSGLRRRLATLLRLTNPGHESYYDGQGTEMPYPDMGDSSVALFSRVSIEPPAISPQGPVGPSQDSSKNAGT